MTLLKKNKIDFKKPRYILPVIFIPFLAFFNHIYASFANSKKVKDELVESYELNPDLPGASHQIESRGLSDKFSSMKKNFGGNSDLTAIQQFEELNFDDSTIYLSAYSEDEIIEMQQRIQLDSIRKESSKVKSDGITIMKELQNQNMQKEPLYREEFYEIGKSESEEEREIRKQLGLLFKDENNEEGRSLDLKDEKRETSFEQEQINVFREQMRIVDSMNAKTAEALAKSNHDKQVKSKKFIPSADHDETNVSTIPVNIITNAFNTVYAGKKKSNLGIPAIIDIDAKAISGSRIRLKILKTFTVGGHVIPKGSYVYAFVTGFGTQRVMLTVNNIMKDNSAIPVKLSLFDNDGYIGLYVPNSVFREFTKEMGNQSTQGLSTITMSEDQSTDLTKPFLTALFQSSSKAVSDMIRQSKVRFKYNYIVYLSEDKMQTAVN